MSAGAVEQLAICPVCMQRTLGGHCPSPTCSWNRCRSRPCDAVLDLRRRRGFIYDRHTESTRIVRLTT